MVFLLPEQNYTQGNGSAVCDMDHRPWAFGPNVSTHWWSHGPISIYKYCWSAVCWDSAAICSEPQVTEATAKQWAHKLWSWLYQTAPYCSICAWRQSIWLKTLNISVQENNQNRFIFTRDTPILHSNTRTWTHVPIQQLDTSYSG